MKKTISVNHTAIGISKTPPLIVEYIEWVGKELSQKKSHTTNPEQRLTQMFLDEHIPTALKLYRPILGRVELRHIKDSIPILCKIVGTFTGAIEYPATKDTEICIADYKALKTKLFQGDSPEWMRFNVRSDKLFKWCSVVIGELVVSPMMELLPHERRKIVQAAILRVSTQVVHLDTRIDDLANVLHDQHLNDQAHKLLSTPLAQLETVTQEMLATLNDYKGGIFKPYFENTASLWGSVLTELSTLCGPTPDHDPLMKGFLKNIQELMESMHFSVRLNRERTLPLMSEMEAKLSSNMMVKIIFDITKIFLRKEGIEFPAEISESFSKFETDLQVLFRLANNIATREREVGERDMTNMIFAVAEKFITGQFNIWQVTHPTESFQKFVSSERFANGESDGFKWDSFAALFSLTDQENISGIIQTIKTSVQTEDLRLDSSTALNDVNYFIVSVRQLLTESSLADETRERISASLDLLEQALVMENKKTAVLCKFLLKPQVMAEFYTYWQDKSLVLDATIAENISDTPMEWPHRAAYVASMEKYKDNNALFLLTHLVFSMVKGAT